SGAAETVVQRRGRQHVGELEPTDDVGRLAYQAGRDRGLERIEHGIDRLTRHLAHDVDRELGTDDRSRRKDVPAGLVEPADPAAHQRSDRFWDTELTALDQLSCELLDEEGVAIRVVPHGRGQLVVTPLATKKRGDARLVEAVERKRGRE